MNVLNLSNKPKATTNTKRRMPDNLALKECTVTTRLPSQSKLDLLEPVEGDSKIPVTLAAETNNYDPAENAMTVFNFSLWYAMTRERQECGRCPLAQRSSAKMQPHPMAAVVR